MIAWAIKQGYGVIDVNVPSLLSSPPAPAIFPPRTAQGRYEAETKPASASSSPPSLSEPPYSAVEEGTRLVRYLWDNYLELTDAKDILLVSIGTACHGLVNMISVRDVMKRVRAVINIYGDVPLRALTTIEDSLIDWYYAVRSFPIEHT